MDLFVVPTLGFKLLYVLVIIRLARRELAWINVTPHPTAEWLAQQITEAFPWNEAPRYLIRDRDALYGAALTRRVRSMGIRDKPIAAGAPWQNCFAKRLIGSIRRECVDVLSENSIRLEIRVVRQNHRMIPADARNPALAWDVHRRLVQAAVPAGSRESVSSPPTQHRLETCAASSSVTQRGPGASDLDDSHLAQPTRCGTGRSTRDHSSVAPCGL